MSQMKPLNKAEKLAARIASVAANDGRDKITPVDVTVFVLNGKIEGWTMPKATRIEGVCLTPN